MKLRALFPAGSRDSELLATLARGEEAAFPGQLVWSARVQARSAAAYAGEVWDVTDLAFEWRPPGM